MLFSKKTYSDAELLDGIRNHDKAVLEEVYRRFLPRIQALIVARGGSAETAQDIFQEVMVVLFLNANRPDFRLTSALYTFMHAIAERMWWKEYRRKTRSNTVSMDFPEVLSTDPQAEDALEYAERMLFLQAQFEALGDPCRTLLQLAIIEEKKPDEVMAHLNIASKSYYYKQKSECKQKLIERARDDVRFDSL